MPTESSRARSMNETRDRILDVALDVLGENPDAGMGDIASAAGVVRRTVYGHFPSRLDLVRTLTERAVTEMTAVLTEINASGAEADATWVEFIARVWPVAHRYRVLLALRRGEYGEAIHGLLGPVDELLADLVERGQGGDVFAQHLPAGILSQLAYGLVFAIADSEASNGTRGARAATITSLLMLGVPEARAIALVGDRPTSAAVQ
ncbi:TetR/AcrR family transcriptional regulator [Catenulispora sp. NL8]|uniref:TetR/AcrR family transcriptional regulator n=1 Tax=Catenulispora pinistramenti TaxID=2705254 RepID=A0ABS5KYP1_9ACTN|nr:TetR/AcrR family transcriptional regulator [Catenulispora pinistramenti]MBS2551110.1 TetR/AcrR family transcriptional regulator [Catenulispora pinistramenti]